MPLPQADARAIDSKLGQWRQGDVVRDEGLECLHLADLTRPHSLASAQAANGAEGRAFVAGQPEIVMAAFPGLVVLTQTCDLRRPCGERPFVEVAALTKVEGSWVTEIRGLRRPRFAYVPATEKDCLVADLDRTMTVEKAVVACWKRTPGWTTDEELRDFQQALSRKHARFAFADDFHDAAAKLTSHLAQKHNKNSPEGAYLKALREIRVRAAPSWNDNSVQLSWWFIKDADSQLGGPEDWKVMVNMWMDLFDKSGRFNIEAAIACRLEDMTARDYVESDRLDLDRLSHSIKK